MGGWAGPYDTTWSPQSAANLDEWFHAMEERYQSLQFSQYQSPNRFFESTGWGPSLWGANGGPYVGFGNGTPIQGAFGGGWPADPRTKNSVSVVALAEWAANALGSCWDPQPGLYPKRQLGVFGAIPPGYFMRPLMYVLPQANPPAGQTDVRMQANLPPMVDPGPLLNWSTVRRWHPREVGSLTATADGSGNPAQVGQVAWLIYPGVNGFNTEYLGQKVRCTAAGNGTTTWVIDPCAGPVDRLDNTAASPNYYRSGAGWNEYIFSIGWWTDRWALARLWTGTYLDNHLGFGWLTAFGGAVQKADPYGVWPIGYSVGNIVGWSGSAVADQGSDDPDANLDAAIAGMNANTIGPHAGGNVYAGISIGRNDHDYPAYAFQAWTEWDFYTALSRPMTAYVWMYDFLQEEYSGANYPWDDYTWDAEGGPLKNGQWVQVDQTAFGGGGIHQYPVKPFNTPLNRPSTTFEAVQGLHIRGISLADGGQQWFDMFIAFDGRNSFQYT